MVFLLMLIRKPLQICELCLWTSAWDGGIDGDGGKSINSKELAKLLTRRKTLARSKTTHDVVQLCMIVVFESKEQASACG